MISKAWPAPFAAAWRGRIAKSPSRCFWISSRARGPSSRSSLSSSASRAMTHDGCTCGSAATWERSASASSSRRPAMADSIDRSSSRTAADSPLSAMKRTRFPAWRSSRSTSSLSPGARSPLAPRAFTSRALTASASAATRAGVIASRNFPTSAPSSRSWRYQTRCSHTAGPLSAAKPHRYQPAR
ncbi:MAG: hypothetical protein A3I14_03545 [Candidatus Rokubacteria bacterium RIFCSPLOWO2_02_FULL_73_56]|nr:MAG: hypothetical protein A3I14_03545 [Candidatus Rokubacteria bacterium RIFCSPLOWO2_02_FULL_73_56]